VGKEIDFEIRFTMGSTSSIGSTPQISMPVSPKQSSLAAFPIQILDSGTTNYIGFTDCFSDKFYLTVGLANATYLQFSYFSATVPMTWATNDAFMIRGSYEAA
jgi:hypothetical protein